MHGKGDVVCNFKTYDTVPRLLPCWVYVIGLGVNEKELNTGSLCPIFS